MAATIQDLANLKAEMNERLDKGEANITAMLAKVEEKLRTAEGVFNDFAKRVEEQGAAIEQQASSAQATGQLLTTVQQDVRTVYDTLSKDLTQQAATHLQNLRAAVAEEINRGTTTGVRHDRESKKDRLSYAKDCPAGKLPPQCGKDEFTHWRRCVELHVESVPDWRHGSKILRKITHSKSEIDEDKLDEIIADLNEEEGAAIIDEVEWNFKSRAAELYTFLIPKLNSDLAGLCSSTEDYNGFEVYRLISQDKDMIHEHEDFHLEVDIQKLAEKKCHNLEETRALVRKIDTKAREYLERVGRRAEDRLLARTLWQAMDEDTSQIADIKDLDDGYRKLKDLVMRRCSRHAQRNPAKTKGNAMDVSGLDGSGTAEDDGWQNEEEDYVTESLNYAGYKGQKGKGGKKGGKGAFAKGGTKGGGPVCHNCSGHGHVAQNCTSEPNTTAPHMCHSCGGYGHFARECPSKGKGKGKGAFYGKGGKGKGMYAMGPPAYPFTGMAPSHVPWMTGNGAAQQGWNYQPPLPAQPAQGYMSSVDMGNMRRLSSLVKPNLAKEIFTHNPFQVLTRADEDDTEEKTTQVKLDDDGWNIQLSRVKKISSKKATRTTSRTTSTTSSKTKTTPLNCAAAAGGAGDGDDGSHKRNQASLAGERLGINLLDVHTVNDLSSTAQPEWIPIKVTVDSGACETVMPLSMCEAIPVEPSPQSQRGTDYEVANGETIPNLGERRCVVMTENALGPKLMNFQVCDVHKPLLSVSKVNEMGYRCILEKEGGYFQDLQTNECIPLHREGNLYVLKAWVKASGFPRQG